MLLPQLLGVVIFGSLLQMAGQLHDRYIGGRDMEGHASELPIQLSDDLAHSRGSTSRSRDDVLSSPMATTPQLPRGASHGGSLFTRATFKVFWLKSSPGEQAPIMAKSVYSILHHGVSDVLCTWHCTSRCGCLSNGEDQRAWYTFFMFIVLGVY